LIDRLKLVVLVLLALATAVAAWQLKRVADAAGRPAGREDGGAELAAALQSAVEAGARAWVGPGGARLRGGAPAAGSSVVIETTLNNAGREPAADLSWNVQRFVSAPNEASAKDLREKIAAFLKQCTATPPKAGQAVLFPTAQPGSGLALATAFEGSVVDADLLRGAKLLVVETCLAYRAGGQPRHSAFCYFYSATASDPQNLRQCEIGNYAD
jgi:hypothetical protein